MSTKLRFGMTLSVICLLVGLAFVLGAPAFATTWDSAGPNAWGGTTDVHRRELLQSVGIMLIGGGLLVSLATLLRWHAHSKPIPRQVH